MRDGILNGIRVLDFTWILAGPYATRILADFGAEVVKIQSRQTVKDGSVNLDGYFNNWNRNKLGITLNMAKAEAKELFFRLVKVSDVVVNNYSPRVMENWGFSYEKLKAVNPGIIVVNMSAMGQTGPWRNGVAYGPGLQALSGLTYMTAYDDMKPEGLGFAYGDHVMGLYGALAIVSAIESRTHSGKGCAVDLSGYEALCTVMGPALLQASHGGTPLKPEGNGRNTDKNLYGCYPCKGKERWCAVSITTAEHRQALWKLLETDERQCESGMEALDGLLRTWMRSRTAEEAERTLQRQGIPAAVAQNADELLHDPHLADRRFFLPMEHPVLGSVLSDRFPAKFGAGEDADWKAAPQLGEDNRYVFRDVLRLTEEEYHQYEENGVFF